MKLADAIVIAYVAHDGQLRKGEGNEPYISHPLRVMADVLTQGCDEEIAIAAVLHDVVEDTPITLWDLAANGATSRTIGIIDALTRRDGETYRDFTLRAAENDDARIVKIADITDNMRNVDSILSMSGMRKRYEQALLTLKGTP